MTQHIKETINHLTEIIQAIDEFGFTAAYIHKPLIGDCKDSLYFYLKDKYSSENEPKRQTIRRLGLYDTLHRLVPSAKKIILSDPDRIKPAFIEEITHPDNAVMLPGPQADIKMVQTMIKKIQQCFNLPIVYESARPPSNTFLFKNKDVKIKEEIKASEKNAQFSQAVQQCLSIFMSLHQDEQSFVLAEINKCQRSSHSPVPIKL